MPVLGAVVIGLALSHGATASSQLEATPYTEAIDLFRRGDDERALAKLARLLTNEVTLGRDALFTAFDSKRPDEAERAAATMRGAVMLHTARGFAALARNNNGEFRQQLLIAESFVDKLASRNRRGAFVRTWPLMVLALLHEGRMVVTASEFGRRTRDPGGDSAELLLALGATEEMAWWIHHEDDVDPGVKGDLKAAERHYRQALIMAPDLTEVRLRLGRVLTLRDDPEGMKILGQIGQSIELPYQYLARLFEGDVLEKRGDVAEAERRYSDAVSLMPTAQSAYMALAHARHTRGARSDAAQAIRSTAGAGGVADTADPWFWYSRGTAWRGRGYVADLQKMIAP
jgi:tetratricopeptide (TPR) repeat protein